MTTAPSAPPPRGAGRLAYLDWLRGVAVVIMIEAHTLDSWTATPDRKTVAYGLAMILGGLGAPLFLFLAGVAVSLAAGSRAARIGDSRAVASVQRRGWEVFGLAFLFRLWTWALSPGATLRGVLKVDILNVMGPSIVAAAALWGLGRSARSRAAWLAAATIAIAMLTPIVRATPVFDPWPDALEAYLRPAKGLSTFTLFPWAAFVMAGAACGVGIHAAGRSAGARVAVACGVAGLLLVALGYGLSFRPSIYAESRFWTTSPTFLCLRIGVLTAGVTVAWAWAARPWRRLASSPLEAFGASSLFVYWIHIELVYGVIATPLKRSLPLPWAVTAFAVFTAFMYAVTRFKLRTVSRWKAEGAASRAAISSAQ